MANVVNQWIYVRDVVIPAAIEQANTPGTPLYKSLEKSFENINWEKIYGQGKKS